MLRLYFLCKMTELPADLSLPGPIYIGPKVLCREAKLSAILAAIAASSFAAAAIAVATENALVQGLGLLGLGTAFFAASFAAGSGHTARAKVRRRAELFYGRTWALAGLSVGWAVMVAITVMILSAAICRNCLPKLR